jgi:hypothetical protein
VATEPKPGPKKKVSGKHVTKRSPVMLPPEWMGVAKALAAEAKRPVQWLICELLEARAKEMGMKELPAGPWAK